MLRNNRFASQIIGAATAGAMILYSLALHTQQVSAESYWQYGVYILMALGITLALVLFSKTAYFNGNFQQLFGQGFKCFASIAIVMTLFTAVLLQAKPEIREDFTKAYRSSVVENNKDRTPAQIDEDVKQFHSQFNTVFIFMPIFGYLIIGSLVTAGVSAALMRRKQ